MISLEWILMMIIYITLSLYFTYNLKKVQQQFEKKLCQQRNIYKQKLEKVQALCIHLQQQIATKQHNRLGLQQYKKEFNDNKFHQQKLVKDCLQMLEDEIKINQEQSYTFVDIIRKIKENIIEKNERIQQLEKQIEQMQRNRVSSKIDQLVNSGQIHYQQLKEQLFFCQKQLQQAYAYQNTLRSIIQQSQQQFKSNKQQKQQKHITNKSTPIRLLLSQSNQIPEYQSGISDNSFIKLGHLIYGLFPNCSFLTNKNRQYIVKVLKSLIDLPISSKLLYKYSRTYNPHPYIDNINDIIILLQLKNGYNLAAFTQSCFSKTESNKQSVHKIKGKRAFIACLNLQKVILFKQYSDFPSVKYDQKALIWGNYAMKMSIQYPLLVQFNLDQKCGFWDGITACEQFRNMFGEVQQIKNYEIHSLHFI